jgi:hypothetical protein
MTYLGCNIPHPRSAQYWSDAVQTRIAIVDDVLQQVPPSALSDTTAFDLVDGEMAAIRCALRKIGTRRNALTPTCRIPTEILGEIFLFYQQVSAGPYILECPGPGGDSSLERRHTLKNTSLRWVPAVAHVCRHWRAVALGHPRLWSCITLRLGREWASRMLALSMSSPITVTLTDPDPCEASIPLDPWAAATLPPFPSLAPRRPQLDPIDVLSQHLFHIQDLDLNACSCTILPWVRLLETAAPLLEAFCLRVDVHRPGTRHNVVVPLPPNFLATHPRLRRLNVNGAILSSWATPPGGLPLSSLTHLSILAPDPRKIVERAELVVPTHSEFLDCLSQMPALESLVLSHCLPPFATAYSTRTVPLPQLRFLNFHDRVDRCRQALDALNISPKATIKISCWSVCPPSEHDCLRILPSLSAHLCREDPNTATGPTSNSSSSNGPHALSLSSSSIDSRTEFILSAWRTFTPPTLAEDREQYFGPKIVPDVRLECEWDSIDDPEVERRALRRACAGVPLDELRALSIRAEAAVWDAHDWYDTFVGSVEITHVAGLETPGESVLDALKLPFDTDTGRGSDTSGGSGNGNGNGSGGEGGGQRDGGDPSPLPQSPPLPSSSSSPSPPPPPPLPPPQQQPQQQQQQSPLFPELVSLTLAGVNFVRANKAAWLTFSSAMTKRQASPACVTILDRIEFRGCTVAEWMVDGLNEYTAVVVWDSVSDPDNWMHVPRDVEGAPDEDDDEGEDDEDEDADADADADDADADADGEGEGEGEGG